MTALLAGAGLALAQTAAQNLPESTIEEMLKVAAQVAQQNPWPAAPPAPSAGASSCGPDVCCVISEVCCRPTRFWGSAEYLLWSIKDTRLPPLVTTGPPASAGILGLPGTTVLFGNGDVDNDERHGGRFGLGWWCDDCQLFGVEGNYLFLGSRATGFTAGSSGAPGSLLLSRPFFDVLAGAENAQLVAVPGVMGGTTSISLTNRLQGGEANLIANWSQDPGRRVDLLAGFRYLEVDEGLNIVDTFSLRPGVPVFGGSAVGVADQFATRNRFYGGNLGARAEFRRGNWTLGVLGKVAVGSVQQVIKIDGTTVITPPGATASVARGGIFALPTNIGRYERDDFAFVPELGVTLGYQVTRSLRATVGYTFLYFSDVVRPGDPIDRGVNISQIPAMGTGVPFTGMARPLFPGFDDTEFWAQGVNFGLEFRY
jgi:hypothetical protein